MEKTIGALFEKYDKLIIVAVFCFVILLTFLNIFFYIKSKKKGMYSYTNISLLGGSIFMSVMTVITVISLFRDNEFFTPSLNFVRNIYATSQYFILLLLPLALVFLLFMGASNASLIIHEGKSVRNLVGTILSFIFFFSTIAVFFGWDIIYQKVIFNIYASGNRWITIFDDAIPDFFLDIICYFESLLIATIYYSIKVIKHKPAYDKDYVIILGCQIRKDGTPTPLLQGRIDRALEFAQAQKEATGKKIKFIPSGGKGSDECISEAESMTNYLLSQGVAGEDIIVEKQSVSTLENMRFSKDLLELDGDGENVIFSTTNYHVFRAGVYAGKAGLKAEGIGRKTKWYFWPNAFAREFVALMSSNIKGHIGNIAVILVKAVIGGILTFVMFG